MGGIVGDWTHSEVMTAVGGVARQRGRRAAAGATSENSTGIRPLVDKMSSDSVDRVLSLW